MMFDILPSLTTIGDSFLYSCYGLTELDLSGLTSLTTIGDHFLVGCNKLTKLTCLDTQESIINSKLFWSIDRKKIKTIKTIKTK